MGKEVAQMEREELSDRQAEGRQTLARRAGRAGGGGGQGLFGGQGAPAGAAAAPAPAAEPANLAARLADQPIDPAASVNSVASAAKIGELFEYTVGNVSLQRQRSAMIPIVTDPIEVKRLSIYNAGVLPRNPLYGARVKNTTGKHLLQGPITVLSNGSYAGDARIEDLPPGQERLISYGVDLEVIVDSTKNTSQSSILTGKVVKGVLNLTYKDVFTQDYVAENKGERAKSLVIEHPVRPGWELVEPKKADETTDQVYRFQGKLEPGNTSKMTVTQQNVRVEGVQLLPTDVGTLLVYAKTKEIPQPVRDALATAAQKKQAMEQTQNDIQQRQQRIDEITKDQARIRENMRSIAQNSDYYQRLLKMLNTQEDSLGKLRDEMESLRQKLDQQGKDLEAYVNGLNVG
jgi:hypothetical protein